MRDLKEKPYFPHLDALRFLAFLAVFLEHFSLSGYACFENKTFALLREVFFYRGYLGVSPFFVISGFLITTLLMHEWKTKGGINIKNFYIRRALRIWPLYFTVLIIGFIIAPLLTDAVNNETSNPWYYLFFAANFNSIYWGLPNNPVLLPMWSLAVEEQFYLFFPILLFLFRGRVLLLVLLLMIGGGLYYRHLLYPNFVAMGIHSITVAPDLIVGVLCGLAYQWNWKVLDWIRNMPSWLIFLIYLVGIYLLFNGTFDFYRPTVLISRLVYTLFFAFIVLEQSFAKNSVVKFSTIPKLSQLGIISYGLYCLHQPALMIGKAIEGLIHPYFPDWLTIMVMMSTGLLLAVFFARLSFRYLEKPFLLMKRKY
jgi:peptidoglycan/LPS O-acetylase OafA/YrhL